MKKILLILVLFFSAFILYSCNSNLEKLETKTIFFNIDHSEEYSDFSQKYNLRSGFIIVDYETYKEVYKDLPKKNFILPTRYSCNKLFEDNVIIVKGRGVSGSTKYKKVKYYFDKTENRIIREYKAKNDGFIPDMIVGYCIDIITVPKEYYELIK
jgi:hypothetical protein